MALYHGESVSVVGFSGIFTVILLPGDKAYDNRCYASASEGVVVTNWSDVTMWVTQESCRCPRIEWEPEFKPVDTDALREACANVMEQHHDTLKQLDDIKTTLPLSSKDRKEYPLYSGPIKYFPSALAEVAKVCKIGNDKHNPGQELHHARGKSADHADCIIRHLVDLSEDYGAGVGKDENGIPQVAYIAWRALALAQEWMEQNEGSPLAPGAKLQEE